MKAIDPQTKTPQFTLVFMWFMRFQPPSISIKDLQVYHYSSGLCTVLQYTPEWRGAKSPNCIIRPRGWPLTVSQVSARARAMIDDEAWRWFYWGCSVACHDKQDEWDPWQLWAPSPSGPIYYIFTYINNVGTISPTINLQTWLLKCELCNTYTKKKDGSWSTQLCWGYLRPPWKSFTLSMAGNIWKYVTHASRL